MIAGLLIAPPLFVLLAGTMLWPWLGSDSGRNWLASTVNEASGGSVVLQGLHGHPLSHLDIDVLQYHDGRMVAQAKGVKFAWSPLKLLESELSVQALEAVSVEVRLTGVATESATDAGDMVLPALYLDRFRAGRLTLIRPDGSEQVIDAIAGDHLLAGTMLDGALSAHLLQPDAQAAMQLSGSWRDWRLQGEADAGELGKLDLSLNGHASESGKGEISAARNSASIVIKTDWRRDGKTLLASGGVHANAGDTAFAGQWALQTGMDLAVMEWRMDGVAKNDRLSRPIKLNATGNFTDGTLSADIRELDQGLSLSAKYHAGAISGSARFGEWGPPFRETPGHLSGIMDGEWEAASGHWHLHGDIDKGELAGVVASLKIDGAGEGEGWQLARADVRALGIELSASGYGDSERFNMNGKLSGQDIGQLMTLLGKDGAAGHMRADLQASGLYRAPVFEVGAVAEALHMEGASVERLQLHGRYVNDAGTAKLTATGVEVSGKREVEHLDLAAKLADNRLKLTLASRGKLEAMASIDAKLDGIEPSVIVFNGLRITYGGNVLASAKQLDIRRSGDIYRMARVPLTLLGAQSTGSFAYGETLAELQLHVSALDLDVARPWLAALPYRIEAHADLDLDLKGSPSAPELDISVTSPALRLAHLMFVGESGRQLTLSDLNLHGGFADGQMHWKIHALAPAGGLIESSGNYAMNLSLSPWHLSVPVRQDGAGKLLARFSRLSDLESLMPRIDPFKGNGVVDLQWRTPVGAKSVHGDGRLCLDALGIPEFGLDMKGSLGVRLDDGIPLVDLALGGGGGSLQVAGPVNLEHRTMPPIRLERFPLIRLPDQQLTVSGVISASEQNDIGQVSGNLDVVQMRLEIPESTPMPTSDLEWQQPRKESEQERRTALTRLDVAFSISEDAEIYGRGMRMKPTGKLHLAGSLGEPQLTGVLKVSSGKIEFRSVKLEIQPDSKVLFSGEPTRPSIFIRAARKVGDVTAGIIVEGPADKLATRLYSTPAMSNSEIFAYIATGRPLATLGKDKAGDVMTAAKFILGPGSMMDEVQNKVKQAAGLDLFEVGGDSSGGYVKAGHNLSDKMSLAVEQSVSRESTTTLTLEYLLTRSVSIFAKQATTLSPSVGLRYSKEWFGSKSKQGIRD